MDILFHIPLILQGKPCESVKYQQIWRGEIGGIGLKQHLDLVLEQLFEVTVHYCDKHISCKNDSANFVLNLGDQADLIEETLSPDFDQ